MTREEIKEQYSMTEIISRYGLHPNRAGFIKCPFHTGDRTASMKIYKDSYHCFGCGANGDIFSFIQQMNNCDFKTAFLSLGGTYQKPSFSSKMAVYRAQKQAEMRVKMQKKKEDDKHLCNLLIGAFRWGINHSPPLSDAWCDNYNKLQYQLYLQETLMNEER